MPEDSGHIIIAGRGRVGGIVERMLTAAGFKTTVIDYSAKQLENLRHFGFHTYYGDATRPDLLAAAGIAEAKMLVIAIDGKEQITELTKYVTQTYPHVHLITRAVDRDHVYDLWAAGSRDIIRETFDSSTRMGRSAFEAMGINKHHAEQMLEAFKQLDREAMVTVANVHKPGVRPLDNPEYMAFVRENLPIWEKRMNAEMTAIREKDVPLPDDLSEVEKQGG